MGYIVGIILALIGILLCMVGGISSIQNDIKRINTKLNKIAEKVGVSSEVSDELIGELKNLISEGKSVKAIKRYRNVTGVGLKESKEYIDYLSK